MTLRRYDIPPEWVRSEDAGHPVFVPVTVAIRGAKVSTVVLRVDWTFGKRRRRARARVRVPTTSIVSEVPAGAAFADRGMVFFPRGRKS